MTMKNKVIVTASLISIIVMGVALTAQAYTFFIDEFSVTKNSTPLFDDKFNDGIPPPSGGPNLISGGTLSYSVFGTMGPEQNTAPNPGKLTLDSSGGLIDFNPPGLAFLEQRAILLTNIDPASTLGLKQGSTFSVTGMFDLIVPSEILQGYGVRFTDGTLSNTNPNDVAYAMVERALDNNVYIRFLHFDFLANTVTLLGQTPLVPDSHTTISLMLNQAGGAVTASYAYDGSSTFTPLSGSMNIFNGENFTRAQFIAFEPVPEPSTMLLVGSGLAGIGLFRRRRTK